MGVAKCMPCFTQEGRWRRLRRMLWPEHNMSMSIQNVEHDDIQYTNGCLVIIVLTRRQTTKLNITAGVGGGDGHASEL
jgi:hypothetical protein